VPVRDRHPVLSHRFSHDHPDLAILYNQISSFGTKPPTGLMLEAMANCEFTDRELAQVRAPTLVVAAQGDSLCPPDVMRKTAEQIPLSEFVTLPGEHSVYFEDPETWNDAVISFIATHSDHFVS
jgi:3-oxoadipate enol-lactonase